MANEALEKRYDVLLTGNDMTSSIVAAACSRIGKKVLLVDCFDKGPRRFPREWSSIKLFELFCSEVLLNQTENDFVGEIETSGSEANTLRCHPSWILSNARLHLSEMFADREQFKEFLTKNSRNHNKIDEIVERFSSHYFPSLKSAKTAVEADQFLNEIREEFPYFNTFSNNFTLDLTPRVLQANGELTDLLIQSNITRYLTFQKVSRLLTFVKQQDGTEDALSQHRLMNVPCTRSDVFKCSEISLKEKRLLMKLLQHINDYEKKPEEFENCAEIPFSKYVEEFFEKQNQPMPAIVGDILLNAVLMCEPTTSTKEALEKFTRFMGAIGRFTDRPYLCSDYGTDDIVQAFCRYSSVYGGVYCLDTKMESIRLDGENNRCTSVVLSTHGVIECDHLVTSYKIPQLKLVDKSPKTTTKISRAITCSKASILPYSDKECSVSFLYVPAEISGTVPVYVFETNVATHACTSGLHVQYYWAESHSDEAENDIRPVVEKLFNKTVSELIQNELLWCLFYSQSTEQHQYENCSENIHIVSPPINEMDYDSVVQEARRIFLKMYPDEEFFPQTKEPTGNEMSEQNDEEDLES